MNKNIILVGHRGTRVCDENTIYAFNKALRYGANYIEFDVRKTKDNQLIIIHDATLERTTNGIGLIKNLTYNKINQFKTKINQEHVPLLSDVLEIFIDKINFMIELKEKNIRKELMNLMEKKDLIEHSIFSSRNLDDLHSIKKKYPESRICYNITKGIKLTLPKFLELGSQNKKFNYKFDMISLRSSLISTKFIEICHRNQILALSWDFLHYSNSLDIIKSLIKKEIDGILFDDYKNILVIKEWLKKN